MNTANWIPDLFMKRMENRQEWSLFRANETPDLHDLYGSAFERRYEEYEKMAEQGKLWTQKLPAIEMWKNMLKMIFETGHPWITFKDPCNVRSPQDHAGVVHSSNLCTEITLNTSDEETAVCNLGSVVLDNHIREDGSLDHDMLKETITVGTLLGAEPSCSLQAKSGFSERGWMTTFFNAWSSAKDRFLYMYVVVD